MAKILLAGIFHETHSFTDDRTTLADFMIHRGQGLLDRIGGQEADSIDGCLLQAMGCWHSSPLLDLGLVLELSFLYHTTIWRRTVYSRVIIYEG